MILRGWENGLKAKFIQEQVKVLHSGHRMQCKVEDTLPGNGIYWTVLGIIDGKLNLNHKYEGTVMVANETLGCTNGNIISKPWEVIIPLCFIN